MADATLIDPFYPEIVNAPTEDDLPYDDGEPMETERHVMQMYLLITPLRLHWRDRDDFYVNGNMFVYFSPKQVKNYDFKGPDVFVVQGVSNRERKSWVVWDEGKGPDVVIELLSDSTAQQDKTHKKEVYQDRLRVPEYFWFDPFRAELAGFSLQQARYIGLEPDANGNLTSHQLQLKLVRWPGVYANIEATWLRWATLDGVILPTAEELAEIEHQQAQTERQRAEAESERANTERQRADKLAETLARYQAKFGDLSE